MIQRFHPPPKIAQWIMRRFLPKKEHVYLGGDFDEIYNSILEEKGRVAAIRWYWFQLIQSLPKIILNSIC